MLMLYITLYGVAAVDALAVAGYLVGYLMRAGVTDTEERSVEGMQWVVAGIAVAIFALILHVMVGRPLSFPPTWSPRTHLLLVPIFALMGYVGWRTHKKNVASG